MGAATVGLDQAGRPIRKSVSAKTRAEVVRKLKALSRQIDDGLITTAKAPTLEFFFERWFVDVMAREVVRSTIDNYRDDDSGNSPLSITEIPHLRVAVGCC